MTDSSPFIASVRPARGAASPSNGTGAWSSSCAMAARLERRTTPSLPKPSKPPVVGVGDVGGERGAGPIHVRGFQPPRLGQRVGLAAPDFEFTLQVGPNAALIEGAKKRSGSSMISPSRLTCGSSSPRSSSSATMWWLPSSSFVFSRGERRRVRDSDRKPLDDPRRQASVGGGIPRAREGP